MEIKKTYYLLFVAIFISVFSCAEKPKAPHFTDPEITEWIETDTTEIPIQEKLFPTVMIKPNSGDSSQPLGIRDLKIDVKIIGNIATTTFEMTFYNDLDRILEGQLYFPLGEGKTVSRFAMDFDGKLREGVIVEKAKGRAVFESIVRRKVDPGLLEWTKGNNFKARVYPIPAKGTKKIVIAYEQSLIHTTTESIYILPLGFKQKVTNFDLKIEVLKQEIKPQLNHNELTNLSFDKWNENYIAKIHKTNYTPNQQIGVALPIVPKSKNYYTETVNKETYFYLNLNPKLFTKEKNHPTKLGLLWDISSSSNGRNTKKELEILTQYLNQFSTLEIEVVTFSNTIHEQKTFSVSSGNLEELLLFLTTQDYDGGTQLGILDLSKYQSNEFLFFSDGLSNFGKSKIKTDNKTVHCLTSNQVSDYSYLKHLAATTGGQFININTLETKVITKKLNSFSYRFINASFNENEVFETYPKSENLNPNGFQLVGKLKSKSATITLNFGFGNEILHSETFTINLEKNTYEGMIRKIWAQKKLNYLDVFHEKYTEEITELGKEYGLVTRNTSLIILDNVEDYIQHKIVPPTEWQKEYFEKISKIEVNKKAEEEKQLERVREMLKTRTLWWNTRFKYIKPKKKPVIIDTIRANLDSIFTLNRPPPPATHQISTFLDASGEARAEEVAASAEALYDMGTTEAIGNSSNYTTNDNNGRRNYEQADYTSYLDGDVTISTATPFLKTDISSPNKLNNSKIELKAWSPNASYIQALKRKTKKELWKSYLELKKKNGNSPSFYLDVSQYFTKHLDLKTALRVLSNLAEMELENHQALRILGYRLMEIKEYELAISVFEEVVKIREEEPQSFRDLGLAFAKNGNSQKAIENLYKVIQSDWDGRFPKIELIALTEMNAIIANNKVNTDFIDQELIKSLPVDVRIVLDWDTDNCDIDLWITDPTGEKCFYSNNKTRIGGIITNDFTQGYGPEVFLLKKAKKGKYIIQANYYGTSSQKLLGPVTLKLHFFTHYGTKQQKVKEVTLQLTNKEEVVNVAKISF